MEDVAVAESKLQGVSGDLASGLGAVGEAGETSEASLRSNEVNDFHNSRESSGFLGENQEFFLSIINS